MSELTRTDLNQTDWRLLLTASERAAMLHDIARVSLAVGAALFPEQPWSDLPVTAESAAVPKSPIEQLSFIEHLFPSLTRDLDQITRSPLTSAVGCTQLIPPERARRVTAGAWMSYARQGGTQRTLSDTVTRASHNISENRAVKSFVGILKRDCRVITLLAEAAEAEVTERATRCDRHLSRAAVGDWWEEVVPRSGDWARSPEQRESLRPEYASVARARSQYRLGFRFDWDHPLLTLPPRETWRLYETWCLFMVIQALRGLGWSCTMEQEFLAVRSGRLLLTLAAGEKSQMRFRSPQGRTLSLTYNPTFAEGRESLSHTMRPDIALSDGERVWILDAKFKPYSEPGEEGIDINQMHAYRDAIVGGQGRIVAHAWCLYAGLTGTANRPHITYGRGADTSVGALCLRPGSAEALAPLSALLRQWLSAH